MEDIRWTIDKLYPDQPSVERDMRKLEELTEKISQLSTDPKKNLKEAADAIQEGARTGDNLLTFLHMKLDEDSRISLSQKNMKRVDQLWTNYSAASAFFTPFLLSLSKEEQQEVLDDPELADYRLTFEKIFRYADHTLSSAEETLLSKMGFLNEAPQEIYYFLITADMTFPSLDSLGGEKLTQENFTALEEDPDPEVRKEAFEKLYSTFESFGNTIATSYYNNVRGLASLAEVKHYQSARQMELFGDKVDERVYDSLLESIHGHLDLLQRYYRKKADLLGLEEQHMYDVYLPLSKGVGKKYSFEEAKELCLASVAPLGQEYVDNYKKAFEEGWIDAYPREGKAGGGYTSGSYDSGPFVLMNFTGKLDSVFTLAHEMGHALHSYYANHSNSFLNANYTIFAAEVASTFNENLLLHYMMDHAESREERLALLDYHLSSFKSTVYRQAMFAEFEAIVHSRVEEGQGLSKEDLNAIYLDLNRRYFGDSIISDPLIEAEWMRIPHFYTDFYVYKYATGYCASTVLSQGVLTGGSEERENYFKFLTDGNKHFPIDQLKMAGCDMSDPGTVDQALEVFEELVEELEAIDQL